MVIMQVLCRIMNLTFFVKTLNFLRVKSKVNVKVFFIICYKCVSDFAELLYVLIHLISSSF